MSTMSSMLKVLISRETISLRGLCMPRLDAEPSWCRSNEGKAVLGLIQMKIESIYRSLMILIQLEIEGKGKSVL